MCIYNILLQHPRSLAGLAKVSLVAATFGAAATMSSQHRTRMTSSCATSGTGHLNISQSRSLPNPQRICPHTCLSRENSVYAGGDVYILWVTVPNCVFAHT